MFVGHIISTSLSICLWSISTFFQSISRFSWSCWLPSHLCGSFVQNTPNSSWRQWHQKQFKRILQKHKYELGKPIDNQQCKQYTLHSQNENKYDIEIHRVLPHHTWPLSDHQTFSYIYISHNYIYIYYIYILHIYITYIYIYYIYIYYMYICILHVYMYVYLYYYIILLWWLCITLYIIVLLFLLPTSIPFGNQMWFVMDNPSVFRGFSRQPRLIKLGTSFSQPKWVA